MPELNETGLIDGHLSDREISAERRGQTWASADALLAHGPLGEGGEPAATGLALGYVQSGKTTTLTALIARAADTGYRVIVAILGSTNILLAQNTERLVDAFGIDSRADYVWAHLANPTGRKAQKDLALALERDRVVRVTVLKHAGRITNLAKVLEGVGLGETPVLIVDDEADQASLNTMVSQDDESKTYVAIGHLRDAVPNHLFVQFTATPYAPLLLHPDDHLRPSFVEFLEPGDGYTGGREFFVEQAGIVVRPIPDLDEQRPKGLPAQLPASLMEAMGFFIAGAVLLTGNDVATPPVSMLVHSSHKNDIQERYDFLLGRLLKYWRDLAKGGLDTLPAAITTGRQRVVSHGGKDLPDDAFASGVARALDETTLWLVNSTSALDRVDWRVSPFHVLVGGNKLDRGFTVEGLTVTYMNRPPSVQVDTIEQRARAFGYRGDLMPYCAFFATPRTIRILRGIVDTEYDLRGRLQDHLDAGGTLPEWATQIGLLLPPGTLPARQNVLEALIHWAGKPGWHQLRRPSLNASDIAHNASVVAATGLLDAPHQRFGRLEHRVVYVSLAELIENLLAPWQGVPLVQSPGWHHDELVNMLGRFPNQGQEVPVVLMEFPDEADRPRDRRWVPETGFVNLMQGADPGATGPDSYRGDRALFDVDENPDQIVVEVHRVRPVPDDGVDAGPLPEQIFTLAIHLGTHQRTTRSGSDE